MPARTTVDALRAVSERVGELQGWDFSGVRAFRDEPPWDYEEVVAGAVTAPVRMLDVGTGGGEVLASLVSRIGTAVAIDHQRGMVEAACRRLGPDVPVLVADGFALPFAADSFGLVTNRHAQVCVSECARVLEPGGVLVVQQVGGRNMQSIFDAFGWGSNEQQWASSDRPPVRVDALAAAAAKAGLEVLRVDEYEAVYALCDLDSLVFTLKAVPFPESFDPARHCPGVNRLLRERSERGVETTEHRELLVARRPDN